MKPVLGPPVWASRCQPAIPQAQPGSLFDKSPQKQPQKASVPLPPVGLVTHGQIQPGFLVHNAALVGEGRKPGLPMIGAHAAFAYAPKAHFAGGQMNNGIIDASAAKTAAGNNSARGLRIGGKDVKSQWMRKGMPKQF